MNRFLSEIQGKYTKIVKNANLIGFLNRLAVSFNLTDSQPLDTMTHVILHSLLYKILILSMVINVMGSRLLSYRKKHVVEDDVLFTNHHQWRSWSATISHREDMVQAGCD